MKYQNINNIAIFLAASIVSKIVGGMLSFVLAKNMEPSNLGIWITFTMIVSLTPILSLGTIEALLKLFPYYLAKEEIGRARKLESITYTGGIFIAMLILMFGLILPDIVIWKEMVGLSFPIRIVSAATAVSFLGSFYYYRFMAHQDFRMVALIDTVKAFIGSILLASFSYLWSLNGVAVGFLLSETITLIGSMYKSYMKHGKIAILFDLKIFWNCIVVGFPISMFWWIFMVHANIDRVASIMLLGKEKTGYYGLGVAIVSIIFLLPGAMTRVLYPRINEKLGDNANGDDLFQFIMLPTRFLCLTLPYAIIVMMLILPLIYQMIPKYLPGLCSGEILVLFSYFRLTIGNGINYLIAINNGRYLCMCVILSLVVGTILSFIMVFLGFGIEGIALSSGSSGIFLASIVWIKIFKNMGYPTCKRLFQLFKLYFPFILMSTIMCFEFLIYPYIFLDDRKIYSFLCSISIFSLCLYFTPFTREWIMDILVLTRQYIKGGLQYSMRP